MISSEIPSSTHREKGKKGGITKESNKKNKKGGKGR
jgi:hypothetical protein